MQPIELIVVDLDGTLLNNQHQMSDDNEQALKAAIEKGIKVVIATGKTRSSAEVVVSRLGLTTPGIYLQGLAIFKPDGSATYLGTLEPSIARQVITFAEDRGFTMLIYSGAKILARSVTPYMEEFAAIYNEPLPEGIGPLQNILGEMPVHKLIAVKSGEPRRINALRWQLQTQLDGKARLTQAAIPDMLEILPPNVSKGQALKVLLKDMGVTADKVLAIGDGENDMEMIQMAAIGVAVENADPKLKAVADHVVGGNQEHGVAEAIRRFILNENTDQKTDQPTESQPVTENTVQSNEGQEA